VLSSGLTSPKPDLTPLFEHIRRGGALAELFQSAAAAIRQSAAEFVSQSRSSQSAGRLAVITRETLQQGLDQSASAPDRQCHAACCACCLTVPVDVTPLEALLIAEYVRGSVTAERLALVRARLLRTANARSAALEVSRPVRAACALLGADGLCTVYDVRPLACAGFFSLSKVACETASEHPDAAAPLVPIDRPARAWTMGISGGLQHALVEAGVDGNLYELNSIVLCALETTDAVHRWLSGEDIFAACTCTDAHSPPRVPYRAVA
jgi:Fe-S-cluster containining protein